jgi:protoheme IX farnesyltransferase
MTGGVEFEHSHRMIAGLVAIFTTLLGVFVWRQKREPRLKKLSLFLVGLVLFQAFLGGLTVIFKLPTLISTTHLATAMLFFSFLTYLFLQLQFPFLQKSRIQRIPEFLVRYKPWIFAAIVLIYAQIVLGALVRHTGAGGVCPTIPLCEGSLWPFSAHPSIRLHMAHRWGAFFIAVFVPWLLIKISRKTLPLCHSLNSEEKRLGKGVFFFCILIPILIFGQILLGFVSVLTQLQLFPVTAHLALGALLLVSLVSLWTFTGGGVRVGSKDSKPSLFQDLLSLTKARLSALVLFVTTISFYIASSSKGFSPKLLFFTLLGTSFLVAGSSFLNAFFEREIDGQMIRTENRPLPKGRLSARVILASGIVLALIGVPILTFWVNPLTGFLGAVAFIFYAFMYTPLKTRTSVAALIGAIPGALPPLIGWTAVQGKIDAVGTTLFFILFFWQLPHFLAIAIFRKKEYQNAGIKIMPLTDGDQSTRKLMMRYSAMLIPISLLLVPLGLAGEIYFFVALILGLIYFIWTCYGMKPVSALAWARSLFLYSLIYLPILFVTLLLDNKG